MTSVIIFGILALFAIISEYMLVKAFHYGVKVGKAKDEIVPEPFSRPKRKSKAPKKAKETEKLNDILHNIDVYDGTSIGQKEIKRGGAD